VAWFLLIGLSLPVLPDDRGVKAQAEAEFAEGLRLRDSDYPRSQRCFAAAARLYRELQRRGVRNAALFRNLGRSSFLAGDLPGAILAYRQALQLAPTAGDIRQELEYLREQVVFATPGAYARPPADERPPWLPPLRPSPWLLTTWLVAYSAGWFCLVRWRQSARRGFLAGGALLLIGAILGGYGLLQLDRQELRERQSPLAVVSQDGLRLRRGDAWTYPEVHPPLNRGVEVRVILVRGAWAQVRLSGGEIGWLPREAILLAE